MFVLMMALLEF